MMSLQSSTHSSQMNTRGPAISLRTSCWLLPQKEQYSILLLSSCLPRIVGHVASVALTCSEAEHAFGSGYIAREAIGCKDALPAAADLRDRNPAER